MQKVSVRNNRRDAITKRKAEKLKKLLKMNYTLEKTSKVTDDDIETLTN